MKAPHIVLAATVVLAVVILWCALRLADVHRSLAATVTRCATRQADVQRCVAAGVLGVAGSADLGASDLVAQVQRALTSAGIASTAFRGVQPFSEGADPGAHVAMRTVVVHLEGIRPSDLGAWLAAWCTPGQRWEVIGIDWSHPPPATASNIDNEAGFVSVSLRSTTSL